MRLYLFLAIFAAFFSTAALAQDFATWLTAFKSEAAAAGISSRTIEAALPAGTQPIQRVLDLDRKQPEKTRTFEQYLANVVTEGRVNDGRVQMQQHSALLTRVSQTYGVQPEVIVALWGIETSYGKNTGGFNIAPALATLAWEGRRAAFFRQELLNALQIADQGHVRVSDLKGSWAGAMGQVQFMPSSFFNFAVDFNGDGRRDIWGTQEDVFASAANYLSKSGWQSGQPWGHAVQMPYGFDRGLIGLDQSHSLQLLHNLGMRLMGGKSVPYIGATHAALIQPGGEGTQIYVVYENYRVIMKWNKSTYFATAVGLLSDRLKNR